MLLQKNEENLNDYLEKNNQVKKEEKEKFNTDGLSLKNKLFHFMRTIT